MHIAGSVSIWGPSRTAHSLIILIDLRVAHFIVYEQFTLLQLGRPGQKGPGEDFNSSPLLSASYGPLGGG